MTTTTAFVSAPLAISSLTKSASSAAPLTWKWAVFRSRMYSSTTPQKSTNGQLAMSFNFNKAVMKPDEGKSFKEISNMPITVLQGLTDRHAHALSRFHVKTVKDLSNWKYAKWAQSIAQLAEYEEKGARAAGSQSSIEKIMDKKFEHSAFGEILKMPVSVLQGVTEEAAKELESIGLGNVEKLAAWKFYRNARAIATLAEYEP
eukprot:CAMPEP_0184693632 /NCGR_PEP_ID=MMETSP0313-20130426/1815_1 /TAXON_ID=2792 /ORGANISM="Porphyridium aerugineum, Strain SAG 1380-2" /LENGTH=202 /DNA_ID=CAMNT_0027151763 /DNA_START=103 /DNA_END=711 /DNA_ORIENTATION=+